MEEAAELGNYLSFVYFNIWQIKQTEPKDFAAGLIGFGRDTLASRRP